MGGACTLIATVGPGGAQGGSATGTFAVPAQCIDRMCMLYMVATHGGPNVNAPEGHSTMFLQDSATNMVASTYFAGSDAGYINGDGGTRRVFGIFGVANSLVFDDCTDATCTGFPYNAPFENNPLLMTVSTGHGPCSFCTVTVQIFVCGSS